jgi:hypothetical protein
VNRMIRIKMPTSILTLWSSTETHESETKDRYDQPPACIS